GGGGADRDGGRPHGEPGRDRAATPADAPGLGIAPAASATLPFGDAMAPHVLVADDDAWILRMVATVLEKRGYSVETAVDGEEALARALVRTPDLLITDVMMPKIDGWS